MRRILKADEVAMEGPLQLSIAPAAGHCGHHATPQVAAAATTVRVAQDQAEYAVIEVTCACGQTTRIRCDYATACASSAPAEPAL
jgi:RNase P subunit RPR2